MKTRRFHTFNPAVESLESRQLLVGNVVASFDTGVLDIAGGGRADHVAIVADPVASTVTVTGRDGTTVNGQPSIMFADVSDVDVYLGGGDNELVVTSTRRQRAAFDTLTVRSFGGDDVMVIENVWTRHATTIRTGSGNDFFEARSSILNGATINLCDGSDAARIHQSRLIRGATVHGGDGDDAFDLRGNEFISDGPTSSLILASGSGDDAINVLQNDVIDLPLKVFGGLGTDEGLLQDVMATSVEFDQTSANLALDQIASHVGFQQSSDLRGAMSHNVKLIVDGNDVTLIGSRFDDRIHIDSDSDGTKYIFRTLPGTTINGMASVEVDGDIGQLMIDAGHGNDEVSFHRAISDGRLVQQIDVSLGSGDDYFGILRQEFAGAINVDAGSGDDFISIHLADNDGASISLGDGDDTLDYFNNRTRGDVNFQGGSGADNLQVMYSVLTGTVFYMAGVEGDDYLYYFFNTHDSVLAFLVDGGADFDTFNANPYNATGQSMEQLVNDWPGGRRQLPLHELGYVLDPRYLFAS